MVTKAKFTERIVRIEGNRLNVRISGGRDVTRTLLICNGLGMVLEALTPFVDAFVEETGGKVKVVQYDTPGIGKSSTPIFPYRAPGLARMALKLLAELGVERATVMGISWGGAVAQEIARRSPQRCEKLILAVTSAGQPVTVPGSLRAATEIMFPIRYLSPAYRRNIAGRLYGGIFRTDKERGREFASMNRKPSFRGYYSQLAATIGWTSIHWLRKLQQETLILGAKDDPLLPPVNQKLLAKLIPNSELQVLDCGHALVVTQAPHVSKLIADFMNGDAVRRAESAA